MEFERIKFFLVFPNKLVHNPTDFLNFVHHIQNTIK